MIRRVAAALFAVGLESSNRAVNRVALLCTAVCFSATLLSATGYCAERDEFEQRLKSVEAQVRRTEKDISNLKQEYAALNSEKKGLEESLKKNLADEKRITSTLADLSRKKGILQRDFDDAVLGVKRKEARVKARLRALYITAAHSSFGELLFRSGGDEVERLALYAKKLKKHDEGLFAALHRSIEQLTASRSELEAAEGAEAKGREDLKKKRSQLEEGISRSKVVGEEIVTKRKAAERALLRLREEAAHLESLLEQLMRLETEVTPEDTGEATEKSRSSIEDVIPTPISKQEKVPPAIPISPTVTLTIETPPIATVAAGKVALSEKTREVQPITLKGLFGKGVQLSAPTSATIVQPFGKGKGSSFSELVSSKGVDCKALEGAQVEALANGKVAFVGQMPGFGTVVILDHGQRHYSMYGRLGSSGVVKGELIAARSSIGTTSSVNEKGRNFYLEVRKDGAPVNPETFVRGFTR